MLHDAVHTHRFNEPQDLQAAHPGVEFQIVPMGRGPFAVEVTTMELGDISLNVGHASPFMGFAKVTPDCAVVQLPRENLGTLLLNGVACQPGVVGVYAGGAELLRANPQPSSFASLILPFASMERFLEPPPQSKLLSPGRYVLLQAEPDTRARYERVVLAAHEAALSVPDLFKLEQSRLALREALVHAARDLINPDHASETRMPRNGQALRRIVVAADEYLRLHMDRPIYTEDLCDALAVSASSLADAFRAAFMISPHRFLKLRRMSMVRAALQSREGPVPLVKSVALGHGFWHLGQFAHDYRETFGEAPSETLERAHGRPAA
ncbi:helix-turn-helix domain-containing protein [Dankookia sp. GCM10030260]|uniref:helix-turn-helix domain-containing protein n=1 Tax=Dankookia sp. GCM10030260 TaxID=3273390 RepID=UPI003614B3C9